MNTVKLVITLFSATSIFAFAQGAMAQDVVMRRPIPLAKTSGGAGWQTTPYVIIDQNGNVIPESSACGDYQLTREVWCQDSKGSRTDEYFCSSVPKPESTTNQFFDNGCSYTWKSDAWIDPGNSCTNSETQTRSVSCIRTLDGRVVGDSFCKDAKPETTQQVKDISGCTYSWKSGAYVDPGASCTEAEIQTRPVTCHISLDNTQVSDAQCDAAEKPADTQAVKDITGCSYSWKSGEFVDPGSSCTRNEIQTRSVSCVISLDGSAAADSNCNPTDKPALTQAVEDYSTCGYTAAQWSGWTFNSTCSATATRIRTAKCQRSNDGGEIVADSECTSKGVALVESVTEPNYSTCTNNWVAGAWIDPGSSCTSNEIQTRSVTCRRDLDGSLQPDSSCSAATKPSMSQSVADYGSCTFSPVNWSPWSYNSTCSANATRTRTAQCERQDGTIVSDSACAAQGVSLTQSETVAIYDSCSYSWTTGSWVDPGNSCTASETQTRSIGCKRDLDGAIVANSLCNAATKPADSQTQSDYSGCTFSWIIGSWTDPGASCTASETQTRSVTCRRSDGTNVGDANCASPTPTSTQIVSDYSGCTYATSSTETACSNGSKTISYQCTRSDGTGVAVSNCGLPSATSVQNCNSYAWSADAWSGWGSCVAPGTQSRTRNVVCQQTNGSTVTTVSDGLCSSAGTKPSTTENQSCTYYTYGWATSGWSNYDNTCSSSATRTRNVTCNRYPDNISVSESNCSGQKPSSSETTAVYSGCSYAASSTETACSAGYKTVSYGCTRSDGAPADLSSCGIGSATSVQACTSYAWNVGGWSGWGACVAPGTQSRTRNVFCEATTGSNKTSVSDGFCGGGKPTSSESQDCSYYSYSWVTGSWGGWSTGCGSATRNRAVWCYRNPDNQLMDPDQSQCTATAGTKPTSQESTYNIYSCGYTPSYGSWSACSNNSQTRTMTSCQRSDGANVSTTDCVNAGYQYTQSQSCVSAPAEGEACTGTPMGQIECNWQSSAWYCTKSGIYGSGTSVNTNLGAAVDICRNAGGTCYGGEYSSGSEYGAIQNGYSAARCYGSPSIPTGTPIYDSMSEGAYDSVYEKRSIRLPN